MGYEWALGALDWLTRRGIEPHEVVQALAYHRRWPRPGTREDGRIVLTLWGRTKDGRVVVIYVRQQAGTTLDWWLIDARWATEAEAAEFTEWEEA